MKFRHLLYTAILVVSITLATSCLGGSSFIDTDLSRDAQIHSFSMRSAADTLDVLRDARFMIDQVQGRIFNREHLPYQFHVDSVVLLIEGGNSNVFFGTLSEVWAHLIDPDTVFTITRNDSIPLNRLHRLETQAADGDSRKMYYLQINIFQQDPNIITWLNLNTGYISAPILSQQTIVLNGRFITYYVSGGSLNAMTSTDGATWTSVPLTGLPITTQLTSMVTETNAVYVLDDANNVFSSNDGITWTGITTEFPVVANYGILPSSSGNMMLLVVDNGGELTFARTDDFVTIREGETSPIQLLNAVPANFANTLPVSDFSAVQVDNPAVYAAKFIILSGGKTKTGTYNNDVWLMEQSGGNIRLLRQATGLQSQDGSRLFYYNNRLYKLIMTPLGENMLMFSENYGLTWSVAVEGRAFPLDFVHRTHTSVIADEDFIWFFGGQTPLGQFSDVWRGRLNLLDEIL